GSLGGQLGKEPVQVLEERFEDQQLLADQVEMALMKGLRLLLEALQAAQGRGDAAGLQALADQPVFRPDSLNQLRGIPLVDRHPCLLCSSPSSPWTTCPLLAGRVRPPSPAPGKSAAPRDGTASLPRDRY